MGAENLNSILQYKLSLREKNSSLRLLPQRSNLIDFSSNDYLGFSKNEELHKLIIKNPLPINGSGGSRLLTGNSKLAEQAEHETANFFKASAALLLPSGYDANLGLFAALGQKDTFIIYDELVHASIRDGIRLSLAKSYSFKHNDLNDFEKKLMLCNGAVIVAVESIYSMDGDEAPLVKILNFKQKHAFNLIVDEAHATGVFGIGKICSLGLENETFARVHTFGKALGVHGAAIVGSELLKQFLINYCRPFIYSTAPSPSFYVAIVNSLEFLKKKQGQIELLFSVINSYKKIVRKMQISKATLNDSSIQTILIPGNENAKQLSGFLSNNGFDVRPILSPTVPVGSERLRICLHSFNTEQQLEEMLTVVKEFN